MKNLLLLSVATLLGLLCFGSPVKSGVENEQEVSDDVKELESLRTLKDPAPSTMASDKTSDVAHSDKTGSLKAHDSDKSRIISGSAIFRHRGITHAKKSKFWKETPFLDESNKYAGIRYSPSKLATYVFQTGDEEGVAVAVEELVREGMMGRTDAINYLQDVKQILVYLREQYENEKNIEEFKNRAYHKLQMSEPRVQFGPKNHLSKAETEKRASETTTENIHQVEIASTAGPSSSTTHRPEGSKKVEIEADQVEVAEETDSNKRSVYKTSNTFTLEVIYKLAKDMFTQSIARDDPTAEETLNGLVSFLESEVGNKRISPEMKEKVLEVVSAAMVDSLRDYQRLASVSGLYQHLSENGGPAGSEVAASEVYHKINANGHERMLQLPKKRPDSS